MKKQATLTSFIFLFLLGKVSAQTDSLSSKYLSIGSKQAGICFGNSSIYTGLRLNLIDKEVKRVNIINFSLLKAKADKSNGISLSLFVNGDSTIMDFLLLHWAIMDIKEMELPQAFYLLMSLKLMG